MFQNNLLTYVLYKNKLELKIMKTKFSIELDEAYYNKLKELAYSEFRSPKATAEMILIKYLNEVVTSN